MNYIHLPVLILVLSTKKLALAQPTVGAMLLYNKTKIPNHYMLDLSSGSILCQFGGSGSSSGKWYGPPEPIGPQATTFYTQQQSGGIELKITEANFSIGLYQCSVREENGAEESVYVGLYTPFSYQQNRGPSVSQAMNFTLHTQRYQQPSVYSLSLITTNSPATYLDWKYSNIAIDVTDLHSSYQEQREVIDASSCTTKSTLTITGSFYGLFSVTISNPRTKAGSIGGILAEQGQSALYVKAAPSPPINVMFKQVSPSSLAVSWSLPTATEVAGIEVFILDIATGSVASSDIPDPTIVNLVLTDLQANTTYSIWLVAYGEHLPSLPTESTSITLNASCSILSVSVRFAGSRTLQLEWVPEPEKASFVIKYDVCTTQSANVTCWTTTITSSSVPDLKSGEIVLVQVRAYTSAGPGQFYNITVAEFPTISFQLATIVGGAALTLGAVLGGLFVGINVCVCNSLCGWIGRRRKRKRPGTHHSYLTNEMSQNSVEEFEEDEFNDNSLNVYEEVQMPPSCDLEELEKKAC